MTATPTPKSPLLIVGFDGTEAAQLALDQAVRFSTSWPGSDIIVVQATDGPVKPLDGESIAAAEARVLNALVFAIEQRFGSIETGGVRVTTPRATAHLSQDEPVEAITKIAYLEGADLILLGAGGKSTLERLILGSVAEGVLRKAPCSVMICRERTDLNEPRIDPPPLEGQHSSLGRRHTYYHKSRNAEANAMMPLVFPMY